MGNQFTKENYKQQIKPYQPKVSLLKNGLKAFLVGGFICMLGQGLQNFYSIIFNYSEQLANVLTIATLIVLTAGLTGMGVFDKIGQFAGAGTLIPVTGFANSIVSAALEHKSEGFVLGTGNQMFKIAGAVLVYGVVAATIIGFIQYTIIILS